MRKVIFSIPITLDGFIEGPHRELDWVIPDDDLHDFATQLMQSGDLLIYGRVTYELMANYWPSANSDPDATESIKRFANTLNPMRKIVYSTTIKPSGWNTQVLQSFDPNEILALKAQPGRDILLCGGALMAQAFFKQGLVDEYIPIIQPVAIGQGKALFEGVEEIPKLELQESRRFTSGTVALTYHVDSKK